MQRVRIGLTGLAAVVLVTMIAAAGFSPEQPAEGPPIEPPKREEPLAELGVAPGGAGSAAAAADANASAVQQEAENALAPPPLQPMSSDDPVRLDLPPPPEGSIHL